MALGEGYGAGVAGEGGPHGLVIMLTPNPRLCPSLASTSSPWVCHHDAHVIMTMLGHHSQAVPPPALGFRLTQLEMV